MQNDKGASSRSGPTLEKVTEDLVLPDDSLRQPSPRAVPPLGRRYPRTRVTHRQKGPRRSPRAMTCLAVDGFT
eukprot:8507094-Lingulodinium_polyedra.AAC.1